MRDIKTQLRSYLETTPEVTFDEIMMAATPSTGAEAEMVRPRSQRTGLWRGPLIAVGTAVAILVVAIGSLLLLGGDDVDVVEEPVSTTLVPPATPTTLVPPATTVPVTETTRTVVGAWNPILSTTVAREAPAAATCPPGTNPDVPGPVDQVRPANEVVGVVTAVFDRHAGRVVYVNNLGETWTFDVCTNTWHQMHATGTAPDFGGLVYDVDSDVTVAFGFESVYVYDANANTWTQPTNNVVGSGDGLIQPVGGAYDPVSGLIITSTSRRYSETNSDSLEFWAYDVDTNEWTLLGPLRREPEPRAVEGFEFLGYSEQLDRLIVPGFIGRLSPSGSILPVEEETLLVDPRTGDVTVLSIESPGIGIDFWPNGTYGAAGGTVYAATQSLDIPHDICGFDANVKTWTACFDTPDDADTGPLVSDSINNRLVLLNAGPWAGTILNGIGSIDLDTGEWTQILAPSPIAYPSTP